MPAANSTEAEFPVAKRHQLCNMALYAGCAGLVYLSAPVVYIGIIQASLCHALGASDTVANLPSAAFYCSLAIPLLVAWRFHSANTIKPVIVIGYLIAALAGLFVAVVLYLPASTLVRIAAVIFHGAAIGGATGTTSVFLWEIVSRGIELKRRGLTYALAYGIGPLLAVVGSICAQLILAGEVQIPWPSWQSNIGMQTIAMARLEFPKNFAALFAATVPLLAMAAALASYFVLPAITVVESPRPRFIAGMIETGRDFVHDRVLRGAVMAYLLVVAGGSIVTVMTLYTPEALGRSPEDYAGYQSAVRFAFKMVAGLFLGWLLVRTNAKVGVTLPTACCLAGVLWVLLLPNAWFLVCFGLMGAGDLYAVYYPNYIMNRSSESKIRHSIAYLQLMSLPVSAAPIALGAISDSFGHRASFLTAGCLLFFSLLIILLGLPSVPRPIDEAILTIAVPPPDTGFSVPSSTAESLR